MVTEDFGEEVSPSCGYLAISDFWIMLRDSVPDGRRRQSICVLTVYSVDTFRPNVEMISYLVPKKKYRDWQL